MARAAAACNNGSAVVFGSSELVNLNVAGVPIQVSGQPNQTVALNLASAVPAGTTVSITYDDNTSEDLPYSVPSGTANASDTC